MRAIAAVAEPVKLGAFANRVGGELEQFAIAEVAELGGAARIVTLRDHGQSVCAMGMLGEMDALEIEDRCPAPIRGQLLAESSYARPLR